jgi:DNA helicase-2/ATP-dependent DNA helicase PcrA
MLNNWIALREDASVVQLMDHVLQDIQFAEYLRDGSDEGEERWANVLELRNVAAEFTDMSLGEFLAEVALVSDVDNLGEGVDAPVLLTLHAAKGLEFPIVFIVGLEEGTLPHIRSLDDAEQCAEERRLMYVGMTRAKDQLHLSYVFMRPRYGSNEPSVPSRFLDDIPEELILGSRKHTKETVKKATQWTTSWEQKPKVTQSSTPTFRAGQRVKHSTFGDGLVIQCRANGSDETVTVMFESAGLKRLMVSMAPLELISN